MSKLAEFFGEPLAATLQTVLDLKCACQGESYKADEIESLLAGWEFPDGRIVSAWRTTREFPVSVRCSVGTERSVCVWDTEGGWL